MTVRLPANLTWAMGAIRCRAIPLIRRVAHALAKAEGDGEEAAKDRDQESLK
jgi:hypothetical protein